METAERASAAATAKGPRVTDQRDCKIKPEDNADRPAKQAKRRSTTPSTKAPGTAKASKKDLPRGDDGLPAYSRERLLKFDAAFRTAMAKAIASGCERGRR